MATGRPLFPGSTVKEELHLIFRLLGQSLAVPALWPPEGASTSPAQAHRGPGGLAADLNPAGFRCPQPVLASFSGFAPLTHPLSTPSRPSRDSYRRDVARRDGPPRVPSLQLSRVSAAAAAQPRPQVTSPPSSHALLIATPTVPSTPQPACAAAPTPCRLDTDGINLLTGLLLVSDLGFGDGSPKPCLPWAPTYMVSVLITTGLCA